MGAHSKFPVLIIGGSGFIGSTIGEHLFERGYDVRILTRRQSALSLPFPHTSYIWDGMTIPAPALTNVKVIMNFAGENIIEHPWTAAYKDKILQSRIQSTRALTHSLQNSPEKPELVIQASAVGFYGMGDSIRTLDESSPQGNDFLGYVCKAWEDEAKVINSYTRLCIVRFGVILGWRGGALPKLCQIYRMGAGAILGSGQQWMNWIHIADVLHFIDTLMTQHSTLGMTETVYNLVAPQNCTNKMFHEELCKHTRSFSKMKVPEFMIRLILGSRAEMILTGPQVQAKALLKQNFSFQFTNIHDALSDLCAKYHSLK